MFWKKQSSDKIETFWGKPKETVIQLDRIEYYYRKRKTTGVLQSISDQAVNDIDFKNVFHLLTEPNPESGNNIFLVDC